MSVNWQPLHEVDFNDSNTIYWVIDTRDFCINCISNHYQNSPVDLIPDLNKLIKYPKRFFYNPQELKSTLNDLYQRSGGECEWRFISFKNQTIKNTDNWQLKYLFVFKTKRGLIICDKDQRAIRKDLFDQEIDSELLAHQ